MHANTRFFCDELAEIVRKDEQTVKRWLKRYMAAETGIRVSDEMVRRDLRLKALCSAIHNIRSAAQIRSVKSKKGG